MLRAPHRVASANRTTPLLVALLALPLSAQQLEERARVVLEQEDAIDSLRGPMGELTRSVENLSLPGARARAVFAEEVAVVDLDAPATEGDSVLELDARTTRWRLAPEETRSSGSLALWSGWLERVDYVESGGFYSIRGAFDPDDPGRFRSPSGFRANARLEDGGLAWIQATLDLDWRRSGADEDASWRLEAFRTTSFVVTRIPEPLYAEVTREALSPRDLAAAQRSLRDEFLVDWVRGVRGGETDLDEFMEGVHEALVDGSFRGDWSHLSVVDVDCDGWDDLYVLPDNATALFFRNRGDGTFEEIGASLGLALENVNGALFADLDNDGDDDAVLSHYPDETRILENTGGRFEPGQDGLPSLAISIAAVDYDADGLLDLYLSRYNGLHIGAMAAALERARRNGEELEPSFPGMAAAESRELAARLFEGGEPFVDIPGPPNALLRNVGGCRFERAEGADAAEPYYQSLAAAWSDVDLDGDQDLYVVNEGGPNQLVRNDGDGRFTDVTDDATRDVGFGMGAAFGDYDEDGLPDIYVTNMYSKAGQRIAASMRSEARVVSSARGNSLLRNTGAGFELVAGTVVEAADFGWGATFLDANNDGTLDLYAPAGYVSMPREVASSGDS